MEKTRIPTTGILDFPNGYFFRSSKVNLEWAAVQEIIMPAIKSRHESTNDDMIVYDIEDEIAIDFANKRNKLIKNER